MTKPQYGWTNPEVGEIVFDSLAGIRELDLAHGFGDEVIADV